MDDSQINPNILDKLEIFIDFMKNISETSKQEKVLDRLKKSNMTNDESFTSKFDYENNFFTDLLSKYYNIQVVNPEDNPDVLFYSLFGDNHKHLTAKRKIFYSGESISQKDDADFKFKDLIIKTQYRMGDQLHLFKCYNCEDNQDLRITRLVIDPSKVF
jgi:hypothetical protein